MAKKLVKRDLMKANLLRTRKQDEEEPEYKEETVDLLADSYLPE